MKKEKKPDPLLGKSGLMKVVMMIVFSLFCFAVSAQTAVSATATSQSEAAPSSASNARLAEFAKNNPNDAQAQAAMKYAMILENPSAYPEISSADLDRIRAEHKSLTDRCNYVDQQMKAGVSYEKASAGYQREMDRKAALDKATNPNRTVQQPAQETAPAMMNGNN